MRKSRRNDWKVKYEVGGEEKAVKYINKKLETYQDVLEKPIKS